MSYFRDADDFCEEHPDVVVLACAILALEKVVGTLPLQRLRRSTLIVDVLSVKHFPKQLLLSLLPPEVLAPLLPSTHLPVLHHDFKPLKCRIPTFLKLQ